MLPSLVLLPAIGLLCVTAIGATLLEVGRDGHRRRAMDPRRLGELRGRQKAGA